MKRTLSYMAAIILATALTLVGTGYAGWFGSDDKKAESEMTNPSTKSAESMSPADPVILSGTINENSQFVDNSGRSFELADTEQGMEVKSLVGRRVEIRGTVMEEMGERIVEVNDYKLLE